MENVNISLYFYYLSNVPRYHNKHDKMGRYSRIEGKGTEQALRERKV